MQEKHGISLDKHLGELSKLRDEATKKGAWSAAINAEVARGKAGGLYIDQKLIMTGNLDNMSAEELEDKMKKILSEHDSLINVTAETIEEEPSELLENSKTSETIN
jgi:hypothetical protein